MKNGILSLVTGAALCFLSAPASAAILIYDATLSGPSESPPNASPATGFARVTIDDSGHHAGGNDVQWSTRNYDGDSHSLLLQSLGH